VLVDELNGEAAEAASRFDLDETVKTLKRLCKDW
jgi:hypothetical protein